ncbi:AAA family ATPase [Streptococcus sp. 2001]|uniref:AAA family ATPase n=1 Tax=Streptococcus sp. 2001 TaxID=2582689 RepID=UPI001F047521|nr:AAA family ATPase [Streptococcus sp. 2001]
MKTFYLIKSLLENGVIRENGTLILDEPEVHLHPEWQLKFAEIIVLLQKEFGLHILINSHSPYLVEAIDIFSKKMIQMILLSIILLIVLLKMLLTRLIRFMSKCMFL